VLTTSQWLGIAGLLSIGAVIAFAFRQGMKVKPEQGRGTQDWSNVAGGTDHGGSDSGHTG
jgi:hypothetical protein